MTPVQSVDDIFFSAVSGLTGGIVTDLTSAMLAMIGLLFIMIALDKIKDSLHVMTQERCQDQARAEAQNAYKTMTTNAPIDPVDRAIAKQRFRNAVSISGRIGGCK
ncbi:MAG: hypothetical protein AB7U43_05235 [Desulfobacter sp.]